MQGIVDMSKEASKAWRTLPPDVLSKYKHNAEKAKEEYYMMKAMTMDERRDYLKDTVDPYAKYFKMSSVI